MSNISSLPLSESLRLFIKETGLPLNQAPEAFNLTPKEFMTWWSEPDSDQAPKLKMSQLLSLAQYLNIDEETILIGTYNRDLVRKRLFQESQTLPDDYSSHCYSCLRSSAHIIKYLTITRGQHFSDQILRRLNVPPTIYSNLDNKINLNYFMDLLDLTQRAGLSPAEMDTLACVLFLTISNTPLGQKISKAKTYYQVYSTLAENIHLFDSNFEYKFDLDTKQLQLKAALDFDKLSTISFKSNRLERLLRYRNVLAGWIPYLAGLPPMTPKTNHQFHRTCVETVYHFQFENKPPRPLSLLPSVSDL